MPVKLDFPKNTSRLPELARSKGPVVDGVYGRKACHKLLEDKSNNFTACLHALTICTTLYAGFWVQFVVQIVYNLPSLHILSGGMWGAIPVVEFYLPVSDRLDLSLAQIFMLLSCMGAVIGLVYAWHFTRQSTVKWRLRGLVLLFCILIGGWSFAGWLGEDMAWKGLEIWKSRLIEEKARYGDQDLRDFYAHKIEAIDEILLKKPN